MSPAEEACIQPCDDSERLDDELQSLEAIFGDDCEASLEDRTCTLWVPSKDAHPQLQVSLFFPPAYPVSQGPAVDLVAPHLSDLVHDALHNELEDIFLPGEEVGFNIAELLRERPELWGGDAEESSDVDGDSGGGHWEGDEAGDDEDQAPSEAQVKDLAEDEKLHAFKRRIISGEPYTERKSSFQAHVAVISCAEEVDTMMGVLLQDNKIRRASHNMVAYRIALPGSGTFIQDYDDDGETAAGSRMLHLLQVANVKDVCVVVSRWFGGTKLGPSRFTIINNTARKLLVQEGLLVQAASAKQSRKR